MSKEYLLAVAALTPERKLAISGQLRMTAWELTAAGIRMREPGLDEAAIQERVRRVFLHAVT